MIHQSFLGVTVTVITGQPGPAIGEKLHSLKAEARTAAAATQSRMERPLIIGGRAGGGTGADKGGLPVSRSSTRPSGVRETLRGSRAG